MTKPSKTPRPVGGLRTGTQVNTFWIDESGSVQTAGKCFVVAGLKTRNPDDLQRDIQAIRDQHQFRQEFKFGRLNAVNYKPFQDLVDVLGDSNVRLAATIVDRTHNPFQGKDVWQAHAEIVSQLVVGNLNKNEVAVVAMDGIATPPGVSLGNRVKRSVNSRLKNTSVLAAFSLDSKSNDLLQAADLIAGAIRNHRVAGTRGAATSRDKDQIARRLAAAFELDNFDDQRSGRVNIETLRGSAVRRGHMRDVSRVSATA